MEMLTNKFNSLLSQYNETYDEFLNTINSNDNSFKSVPESAFIGKNNIKKIQGSSVNKCKTSCSSNKSCTGATFDNKQRICSLSSGTGNIINSHNQTAIVKQALYYSYQLQNINNQLTSVNTNMMTLANSRIGDYNENQKITAQKAEILQNNYKTLEQERSQIAEIIRQYETLNSAYENGSINLTSNYYNYIMYLIVAIFLIILFLRYTSTSEQIGGGMRFGKFTPYIFLILAFIIVVNAILKN